MSICLRVSNTSITIEGDLPKPIADEIRSKMSYVVPGHKFMPRYKQDQVIAKFEGREAWDGTKTVALWNRGSLHFPCGLYSYCKEVLTNHQIPYSIVDERLAPRKSSGWSIEGLQLRDYQQTVVDKALKVERGVMKAATGSGKTEIVTQIISDTRAFPAMFYVTSCDLLMQAHDRLSSYIRYNGQPVKIGKIGAGCCDLQPITVATVQSCEMAISGSYTKNKYDDCSLKDGTKFEDSQRKQIVDLVRQSQFVFLDECFVNHTRVLLPNGRTEIIGKLVRQKYDGNVISWNETKNIFEEKQVIGWISKKPSHPIIRVETGRIGGIISTSNHLFYTKRGQIKAGNLKRGDLILSHPSDNRNNLCLSETQKQVVMGTSLGDGSVMFPDKKSQNARITITHSLKQKKYLLYKCNFFQKRFFNFRKVYSGYTGKLEIQAYSKCSSEITEIKNTPKEKIVSKLDFLGICMLYFDDGSTSTKSKTGIISTYAWNEKAIINLVKRLDELGVKSTIYDTSKGKVVYIYAEGMDVLGPYLDKYAPLCMKYKVPKEFRTNQFFIPKPDNKGYGYITVRNVKPHKIREDENVYCLKVKDNHNFVAAGIVVHNCQHTSAETIQTILSNSYSARYRYGGSASPWRDDGLDILIEAAFGRRFCDISASFLIDNGWLIEPTIIFNHFDQNLGPAETWAAHYSKYVVNNEVRNRWIAERALYHMERSRPVIVLVKHVPHAENIAELMNHKCEILTSSGDPAKTPKNRKKYLDQMRNRELMCIIATSLLDEGVDVPAASVGIFAGGGKSSTRELQRVGRFIRKDPNDPNKTNAYIEEFYDHTRFLSHHTKARLKILQTEPRFQIVQNRETASL